MEGIQGGNAVHGFMVGAVSKAGEAAIDTYSPHVGKIGALVMNSVLSGVVDELGGGKFANGAITGAFSYLFNETMHRVQDRGDSDGEGSRLPQALATSIAISQADSPMFGPADVVALTYLAFGVGYEIQRHKVYLTYILTNDEGKVYIGRTSGFGTPRQVMMRRFYCHHMRILGYKNPQLDAVMWGPDGKYAIRGREQQMIDYFGGVGSPKVGNLIRGVSKINPAGRIYHRKSNFYFGNIAPYTGFKSNYNIKLNIHYES